MPNSKVIIDLKFGQDIFSPNPPKSKLQNSLMAMAWSMPLSFNNYNELDPLEI